MADSAAPNAAPACYHAHFRREQLATGEFQLLRRQDAPAVVVDPTGRRLKVATVDTAPGICPSCERTGRGAYLSFVQDLRMAYACPSCTRLVWLLGA